MFQPRCCNPNVNPVIDRVAVRIARQECDDKQHQRPGNDVAVEIEVRLDQQVPVRPRPCIWADEELLRVARCSAM